MRGHYAVWMMLKLERVRIVMHCVSNLILYLYAYLLKNVHIQKNMLNRFLWPE